MSNIRRTTVKELSPSSIKKPIPYLENAIEPFQNKPHVSTWWLTMNSNKTAKTISKRQKIEEALINVLKECFLNEKYLLKFLDFNQKYFSGHSLTVQMLEDSILFPDIPGKSNSNRKLTYVREVGTKKHRVHLHAKYRIIHYSNITINLKKLHDVAQEVLISLDTSKLFKSVYTHVEYVPSPLPLYNYMMKGTLMKSVDSKKVFSKKDLDNQFNQAVDLLNNLSI